MDAQPSTPPIPPTPPTPPQTPPRISFIPPLYLQRRTAVHSILRNLSSSPRFAGALRSLLDVGCGVDCLLLRSLIPCEDELPIERLTGIDIDADIWSPWCRESISPGSFGGTGAKEDRWRGLDVSLLHGSFTHLNTGIVPRHDVIVSTEVIEHLDPEPLAQFAPVLLGKMKPRVCVITTPNRDFNKVFELPFTPLDDGSGSPALQPAQPGEPLQGLVAALEDLLLDGNQNNSRRGGEDDNRFWRVGVPYPMRHHDHRFEWTRAEFRKWARTAAEEFGYDVSFTGVGGLDCGTRVKGGTGWAVEKALRDAMAEDVEPCRPDEWETSFGPSEGIYTAELTGDLAARARVVFGHCSQIAVFTIKEFEEPPALEPQAEVDWKSIITPDNWFEMPSFSVSDIRLVCHEKHPFEEQEVFPPSLVTVLEMVEKTLVQFIPQPILEHWTADECTWENSWRNNAPAEVVELLDDGDEELEQQRILERAAQKEAEKEAKLYMSKLMQGMPPEGVTDVVLTVDFRKLYDACWRLQRACRFHFDVFERVLASAGTYPAVGQVADGEWATIIDTGSTAADSASTTTNLAVSVLNNTTKVTFNFPQPPPPPTEIRYITYEEPTFETQEDYWKSWDDDDGASSRMSVESTDMATAEMGWGGDTGIVKLWVEATWGPGATEEVPVAAEKGVLRLGRNGGILGEGEEEEEDQQQANGMVLWFRKPPT